MVGEDLYKSLQERLSDRHHVLWMGDLRQLKPVKDQWSPVFSEDFYAVRQHLFQILRQSEGSPILRAADAHNTPHQLRSEDKENGRLTMVRSGLELEELLAFHAEEGSLTGQFKVMAWRNNEVDRVNQLIRRSLFGVDVPQIVEGDLLVARSPCIEDKSIVLFNSDEVVVQSVELRSEQLLPELSLDYFDIHALNDDGHRVHLRVLHEDSKPMYNQLLQAMKDVARKKVLDRVPSRTAWAPFYELKEYYHDLTHAYAITVHRAQGSTYETAVVLGKDVQLCREADERARLWYTGCTRASKHLIIHL